jgi:hypothetical protein
MNFNSNADNKKGINNKNPSSKQTRESKTWNLKHTKIKFKISTLVLKDIYFKTSLK